VAETIAEVRDGRRSAQTTLELQLEVLGGLDTIADQLDQVVAVLRPDREPRTDEALAAEERLAASRQALHDRVLSRLADDAASPGDLPLVAALLHVIASISRMEDQCQVLIRVMPRLSQQLSPHDDGRVQLSLMGQLAHSQLLGAKKAFLNRNMNQVDRLVRRDCEIKRAGRKVFERAIASGCEILQSAMVMLIASRSLEGIADEAIEIGEQAAFISTGLFKEFADALAYGCT
jgi:phosphate transport system protein